MNDLTVSSVTRKARVRAAIALSAKEKSALKEKIIKLFPECDGVVFEKDSALIAGIRIEYMDNIYDDTLIHAISNK